MLAVILCCWLFVFETCGWESGLGSSVRAWTALTVMKSPCGRKPGLLFLPFYSLHFFIIIIVFLPCLSSQASLFFLPFPVCCSSPHDIRVISFDLQVPTRQCRVKHAIIGSIDSEKINVPHWVPKFSLLWKRLVLMKMEKWKTECSVIWAICEPHPVLFRLSLYVNTGALGTCGVDSICSPVRVGVSWPLELPSSAWSSTSEWLLSCVVHLSLSGRDIVPVFRQITKKCPSETKNCRTLFFSGLVWHRDWAGFRPPRVPRELLHMSK